MLEERRREVEGSIRFARDRHAVTIRMCRDRSWKVIGVSDEKLEEGRVWRRGRRRARQQQRSTTTDLKTKRRDKSMFDVSFSIHVSPQLAGARGVVEPFFLSCCFALAKFLLPRL